MLYLTKGIFTII